MCDKKIFLRKAEEEDSHFLFELRNDELVRKSSFKISPILWETHRNWLVRGINSENEHLYVLTDGIECYGQVRLSVSGEEADISYSIKNEARGRGLGKRMLKLAESVLQSERDIMFVGKVKKDNIASQKVFERLGYLREEKKEYYLYTKMIKGCLSIEKK